MDVFAPAPKMSIYTKFKGGCLGNLGKGNFNP